jgi:hypothetical protein
MAPLCTDFIWNRYVNLGYKSTYVLTRRINFTFLAQKPNFAEVARTTKMSDNPVLPTTAESGKGKGKGHSRTGHEGPGEQYR